MSARSVTGTTTVVHVTEANGAGVETYLRLVAEHVLARLAFVLDPCNPLGEELERAGHRVVRTPLPRSRTYLAELRAARALRRVLDDLQPDVVHLHSSQAGVIGRIATRRRPYRVVYTPHAYYYLGASGAKRALFLGAERVLGRAFPTHLLATSPSELARAREEVGVPATRSAALLNAVELDPREEAPPRPLSPRPHVGLVGRVCDQKNLPMFLRTVRELKTLAPHVRCSVVGVGHRAADQATLATMMEVAGVGPEDVTIVGWMPRGELLAWLDSCDVAVSTSRYESFGYTLAEAAARGVPAVATDVDGVRDVVVEGVSGHLVPPDDHRAMAQAIVRLTDAEHHAALSRGAAAVAAERFDVRGWAAFLTDYYRGGDE